MANLENDSPLSRRIARSFLQFLNSVETPAEADGAALEVAKDYLAEVFKIDQSSLDTQSKCDSLVDFFSFNGKAEHSDGNEDQNRKKDQDKTTEPHSPGGSVGCTSSNLWLAENPSKRWGEIFFLLYTPFWLTLCLGIVVPYKLYENFTELEYLCLGLISALPAFIIPMIFVGKADGAISWKDRYWVKANLWIILFSYVGNYFWTHYFFTVLGASYTFPSWKMNNVPHTTFLLTHVCFLFYHVTSNMTLRRVHHSVAHLPEKTQWLFKAAWILALSYFIAYLETLAISNFPYYEFVDRASMYKVGSLFYAIYFFVSFPMFLRIDEKGSTEWDLHRVAIDALGAAMLVTIILDLWRIFLGPIVPIPDSKQCLQPGLPWLS